MTERVYLIDGDVLCYYYAFRNRDFFDFEEDGNVIEHEDIDMAIQDMENYLDGFSSSLESDWIVPCVSSTSNFRKDIFPEYKANRITQKRPVAYYHLRHHLLNKYDAYCWKRLEADDVMGILSTSDILPGQKIIVSIDKDMMTIPGWYWNDRTESEPRYISEKEANYNHLMQTLVGDSTDNYKGCPGIGKKKAKARIKMDQPADVMWSKVVQAYEEKDLGEDDALLQARVAYILRNGDYVRETAEVKLWTP